MSDKFDQYDKVYDDVVAARRARSGLEKLNVRCYSAALGYLNLVCEAETTEVGNTLMESYNILDSYGVHIPMVDYATCAILEALCYADRKLSSRDTNEMAYHFIQLRTGVLEYAIDKYPPVYADGVVYHTITGVSCEARQFSYIYNLSEYYRL